MSIKKLGLWTVNRAGHSDGYSYAGLKFKNALEEHGVEIVRDSSALVGISFTQPYDYQYCTSPRKIGYTPWETTEFPVDWVKMANKLNGVWTTSNFCKEALESSGIKKDVRVLVHGIDKNDWTLSKRKNVDKFTFFHVGEPSPRKNGQLVAEAFVKLFKNKTDVELLLKASEHTVIRFDNPFRAPDSEPNIRIETKVLSVSELNALFHTAHCLVYPSSGEGFGMIPFQAAATGMPTLVVNWGGIKEFENYITPLEYKVKKSGDSYHIGDWAWPSFDDICDKMLDVYNNREKYFDDAYLKAQRLRKNKKFSWYNIAETAIQYIGDDIMAVTSDKVNKKAKPPEKNVKTKVDAEEAVNLLNELDILPLEETNDALDVAETGKDSKAGKVLMKMDRDCVSWTTHDQVIFTKNHPFQLVEEAESDRLMREGGFRRAHPEEVKNWYYSEPTFE